MKQIFLKQKLWRRVLSDTTLWNRTGGQGEPCQAETCQTGVAGESSEANSSEAGVVLV